MRVKWSPPFEVKKGHCCSNTSQQLANPASGILKTGGNMSGPLPPYLGTWEQLMQELLLNPFLGSPSSPVHHRLFAAMRPRVADEPRLAGPWPWSPALTGSGPNPWKGIAEFLVAQISLKELASSLPPEQTNELTASIESSIEDEVDDICGTRPPGWHWPGPPPWIFPIASELALMANTFQQGNLREGACLPVNR
jgi:hypothetical protein